MNASSSARLRSVTSAIALAAACTALPSAAQAEGNRPDLAFGHIGGEIGTGVFCAGTTAFYFIPQQKGTWAPFEARTFDPITGGVSDLTAAAAGSVIQLGLGYLFETGYLATAGLADPASNSTYAVLVEGESLLLSTGIVALIKRLTGRCRPRAYDEDSKNCDEYDAFPSGHTASAASFAGARLVRSALTPWEPAASVRLTGLFVAEANMVITGALRISSGSHSWEDVLVGALIGHATGVGLELLHQPKEFGDRVNGKPATIAGPQSPVFFSFGGSF
jgi:membrane-associated phospholipid phosphatase